MRLSNLAGSTEVGSSTTGSEPPSTQSATPPLSPLCGSDDTDIFASNPIAQHMAMYAPNSPLIARYMQEVGIPEDSAQTSAVHGVYRLQLEATETVRKELSYLYEVEGFSLAGDETFDVTETTMGTDIDITPTFESAEPDEPAPAATVTYLTSAYMLIPRVSVISHMISTAKNAPQRQERLGEPSSTALPVKSRRTARGGGQPKQRRPKSAPFIDSMAPGEFRAISMTPMYAEPDELNIQPSPKKSKPKEVAYLFACSLCPDSLPSRLKSDVVRHLDETGCDGAIVPFKSEGRYLCRHCDHRTDTLKEIWKHERKCVGKPAPRSPHDQESIVDLTQPEYDDSAVPPIAPQGTSGVPESSKGSHCLVRMNDTLTSTCLFNLATAEVGIEVDAHTFKVPAPPNLLNETVANSNSEHRVEFSVMPTTLPVQLHTRRPSSPSESSLTSLGELAEGTTRITV